MTLHERVRREPGAIKTLTFGTAGEAELAAAQIIREHLTRDANHVLGLATGRTMVNVYALLRQWYREGSLSFARTTTFNLDEYCDLEAGDPSSFACYMREHLFDHVDISEDCVHFPDQHAPDNFDRLIQAHGGIDLQLLGIGRNGHIGFNEPGARLEERTRIVTLAEATREANAADFPKGRLPPKKAVTMGIATILGARRILLLATGAEKAEALEKGLRGPIDPQCPASYLQLHPDVTVICDRDAAKLLGDPT